MRVDTHTHTQACARFRDAHAQPTHTRTQSGSPSVHVVLNEPPALPRAYSRGATPNLPLGGGQGALRVWAPRGGGPGRGGAGRLRGLVLAVRVLGQLRGPGGAGRGGPRRQEAGRGLSEALGSEGGRGQLPEGRLAERTATRPGAEPQPAGREAAQPRARSRPQPRQHGRPDRAG